MPEPQPRPLTILDGGMSRELIRLRAPFRLPEWSALALIETPDKVLQVHREFAAAGADVLTTNSYGVVPYMIGSERFHAQGGQLAALSGQLARQAADEESTRRGRPVLVAGCLPPVFGSYQPHLFDDGRVQDYLAVLVRGLAPYVDIWLGETLSLVAEARAVQQAVKDSSKPFWVAFTLDDSAEPTRLHSGESVTDATRWTLTSGAQALLFNCAPPEFMASAVREATDVFTTQGRTLPLGVYANAFTQNTYVQNDQINPVRDDLNRQSYVNFARDWVSQGVTIVGGCCGIGCGHIERLVKELNTVTVASQQ